MSSVPLPRRLLAEFLGTALLVAIVVGSGIAAQQLSPTDTGLQLLQNSTATVLGLSVLIVMFAPISGAHFNPVVTVAVWFLDRQDSARDPLSTVGAYCLAQIGGGITGALLANAMFEVPPAIATTERTSGGHLLAEVVATAVLLLLIFSLVRTGRAAWAGPAVGAYIGSAYWFTSSTSFANPAVTIGRTLSDTFAGITPGSAVAFIAAQLIGLVVGVALTSALFPGDATREALLSRDSAATTNRLPQLEEPR